MRPTWHHMPCVLNTIKGILIMNADARGLTDSHVAGRYCYVHMSVLLFCKIPVHTNIHITHKEYKLYIVSKR